MAENLMKPKEFFDDDDDDEVDDEDDDQNEEVQKWDNWNAEEEESEPDFLCLFCDLQWASLRPLFHHCISSHSFDFQSFRKCLALDFYDSLKLINYIRSQVAENRCWSCSFTCQSNSDLQAHLHAAVNFQKDGKLPWQDDKYLKPFMEDDALLHSFGEDHDYEDDCSMSVNKEDLLQELVNASDLGGVTLHDEDILSIVSSEKETSNGTVQQADSGWLSGRRKDKNLRVSFANVAAKEIKNVNENYFSAYSSFSIHREMLSDKVRTDSYQQAILNNPSLMKQAAVMDVGCGTGILSLFAAQAGASRVIAVEASDKMASVATQIAKDNDLLHEGSHKSHQHQVITVVQGMVEELENSIQVLPHSIDVLLSEWMGYCLLYESMLSSVLYARDHWLKPGGAILPDIATMFVAGFGKGGTSIPFWESVYGFDMSCIGKEVVEDASQIPIIDVIDSRDIVTNCSILHTFDLASMKANEVDFTESIELEPKYDLQGSDADAKPETTWCYGMVLWFETAFSIRFCKDMPVVLSTSPYCSRTHWSQTILTFREPIAMAPAKCVSIGAVASIGSEACPTERIRARISIARSSRHRSIDVSLEITGISSDGQKRSWPVQIFNL